MNDILRIRQLAGLSTDKASMILAEGKKKKAEDAAPALEAPEGLFATGKAAKITKFCKTAGDLKGAMALFKAGVKSVKDADEDRKAEFDAAKEAITAAFAVKESFDILRRMAGLAPIVEKKEKAEEESADDAPPAEGDEEAEEDIPAIIKKIAKKAEGKSGDELEDLLQKVYDAGFKDGIASTKEDADKPAEEDADVKEAVRVMQKGGSIGEKPGAGKEFEDAGEAKAYAARMNKMLSPGEKKYYGIKYVVVKDKKAVTEGVTGKFKAGDKVAYTASEEKPPQTYTGVVQSIKDDNGEEVAVIQWNDGKKPKQPGYVATHWLTAQ
jgi:hypothetical protein